MNPYPGHYLYKNMITSLIKWAAGEKQPACKCLEIEHLIDTGVFPDGHTGPRFKRLQPKLPAFKNMLIELCNLNYQCQPQ